VAHPKRTSGKRTTVTLSVHGDDLALLRAEAERTGSAYGKILREYAIAYMHLRDEALAAAAGTTREGSLIHTMLTGMEARLAVAVDGAYSEVRILRNETQILTALLDSFLMAYLAHTPEVPKELEEGHLASAYARYDKVIAQLPRALEGDRARVLATLRDMLDEAGDAAA